MTDYNQYLPEMADDIHARNVEAGWWTNLKDIPAIPAGASTLKTRNRAELLMLVVSEITEAHDGIVGALMDDKLPHLNMYDVELADVQIRLCDMIGAENALLGNALEYNFVASIERAQSELTGFTTDRRLLETVNELSRAMEHLRKGRIEEYRTKLADALSKTIAITNLEGINLPSIVAEKLAFNKVRPDHKIENRVADGGKAF